MGPALPAARSLSLSLHPYFSGHALCGKYSPSALLQGLLWEALCVHIIHQPNSATLFVAFYGFLS